MSMSQMTIGKQWHSRRAPRTCPDLDVERAVAQSLSAAGPYYQR
jgi:hypothetical protein